MPDAMNYDILNRISRFLLIENLMRPPSPVHPLTCRRNRKEKNMKNPTIGKNVYIAEGAVVRGDVTIGDESSVWFNAVIRADREPVVIGRGTNIQDNSVVHVETGAGVVSETM